MGGKFAWVKPEVYPLIGAVTAGCMMGVYIATRKAFFDPSVDLTSRGRRHEGVKPENEGYNEKASAFHGTAVFQALSKLYHPDYYNYGEHKTGKA